MPKQSQESLKAMHVASSKVAENAEIAFGSTAVIRKAVKAKPISSRTILLDSGATTTLFKRASECVTGTYEKASDVIVKTATGSEPAKFLGSGTLSIGKINLPGSIHVCDLNDTLVSVGQIYDDGKLVVFTKKEAIILNLSKFVVNKENLLAVVPRCKKTRLYEFSDDILSNRNHGKVVETAKPARKKTGGNPPDQKNLSLWHNRLFHLNKPLLKRCTNMLRIFQ